MCGDLQDHIENCQTRTIIALDFPQGGSLGLCSLPQIGEHRLGERDGLTPLSPGPLALLIWGAQFEREGGLLVFRARSHLTHMRSCELCPIGLSSLHAIIPRKGELSVGQDRDGLKLFVAGRERFFLQVPVAGLLDHVGHRHKGVGVFPRIVHLGAQGSDLFFDQSIIFLCFPLPFRWSDQPF